MFKDKVSLPNFDFRPVVSSERKTSFVTSSEGKRTRELQRSLTNSSGDEEKKRLHLRSAGEAGSADSEFQKRLNKCEADKINVSFSSLLFHVTCAVSYKVCKSLNVSDIK